MSFKKQGLFNPDTILPFGKYKGRSVSSVYSGDAANVVRSFIELMRESLSLIFSKEFYSDPQKSGVNYRYQLASSWDGDIKRINETELRHFVDSLNSGAVCTCEISTDCITVRVTGLDDKVNLELSRIGCKLAK